MHCSSGDDRQEYSTAVILTYYQMKEWLGDHIKKPCPWKVQEFILDFKLYSTRLDLHWDFTGPKTEGNPCANHTKCNLTWNIHGYDFLLFFHRCYIEPHPMGYASDISCNPLMMHNLLYKPHAKQGVLYNHTKNMSFPVEERPLDIVAFYSWVWLLHKNHTN